MISFLLILSLAQKTPAESGKVCFEGQWMTAQEKAQKREQREIAAAKAHGFEIVRGSWMLPDEKEARNRGDQLINGNWSSPLLGDIPRLRPTSSNSGKVDSALAEKKASDRLESVAKRFPSKVQVYEGFHFRVIGTFDERSLKDFGQNGEQTWTAFQKLFRGEKGDIFANSDANFHNGEGGRIEIYIAGDASSYGRLLNFFAAEIAGLPDSWVEESLKADHVILTFPVACSISFLGKKKARDVQAETVHQLAHLLLHRYHFSKKQFPIWYEEGLASLLESQVMGNVSATCKKFNWKDDERTAVGSAKWDALWLKNQANGLNRPLRSWVISDPASFSYSDFVQAVCFVRWMGRNGNLPKFHDALLQRMPDFSAPPLPGEASLAAHELVFKTALGLSAAELEKKSPEWVEAKK